MLESSIVHFLTLDERIGKLDLYKKPKALFFFKIFRTLIEAKINSFAFTLFFKLIFFMQVFLCSIEAIQPNHDNNSNDLIGYLSKVIITSNLINDSSSFQLALILQISFTVILIAWIIIVIISGCLRNVDISCVLIGLNFINDLLRDYLLFPFIKINLLITYCNNTNQHNYMDITCFTGNHLILMIFGIISIIIIIGYIIILMAYNNQIGSLKESTVYFRINSHYELYEIIAKLSMIGISYYISYYGSGSFVLKLIAIIIIIIICFAMCFYIYKHVLFYYEMKNTLIFYGWVFVTWSSFVMLLKLLFELNNITFFLIIGWIILSGLCYYLEANRLESLLIKENIFQSKSIKEIELYINKLIRLSNDKAIPSKTLLKGIIYQFTNNIIFLNEEFNEKYMNIYNNEVLFKTGNCPKETMSAIAIIYIIYSHHLKNSQFIFDIFILFSHFIIRKLHNPSLVLFFCAKIKEDSFKHFFLKYLLIEEIKDIYIKKLLNQIGSESIRHIQLSSVILYDIYIDSLKLKIYDGICNQIDYFDMIKNDSVIKNKNLCSDFIDKSEEILKSKKDILSLWQKIINLNPFNNDIAYDYFMYLDSIVKDDQLAKKERKSIDDLKMKKYHEKDNIYYLLFEKEQSTILIVDGNDMKGRIIYATPNFEPMYNFNPNEVINVSIDQLLPNAIVKFHSTIMNETIKYSNIRKLFSKQRETYIKEKNGTIYQVKMFLKPVPNLTYGLLYIISFIRSLNNSNMTVLLDQNLIMIDMSYSVQAETLHRDEKNGNSLNGLIGNHIGMIMPEILLHIDYSNEAFNIIQSEIDLKGFMFQIFNHNENKDKIMSILESIKLGEKITNEDLYCDKVQNEVTKKYQMYFNSMMNENKPKSIFFRIEKRSFVKERYSFYIISITNPLHEMNELYSLNCLSQPEMNSPGIKKLTGQKQDTINTISLSKNNNNLNYKRKINIHPTHDQGQDVDEGDHAFESKQLNEGIKLRGKKGLYKTMTLSYDLNIKFRYITEMILKKNQSKTNLILNYLTYLFGIGTFIMMIIQLLLSSSSFTELIDFLEENHYFNHSKIYMAVIYSSVANTNYIKNNYIQNSSCFPSFNCTLLYSEHINSSVNRFNNLQDTNPLQFKELRSINNKLVNISLYINDYFHQSNFSINLDNLADIILVNSLYLNNHLSNYTSQIIGPIDIVYDNVNTLTYDFINNPTIKGYTDEEKTAQIKQFSTYFFLVIINCSFLFFLIVIYSIVFWKTFVLEKHYSKKFLHFNPPSFLVYLKYLEGLKQKLREQIIDEENKDEKTEINQEEIGSKGIDNNKGISAKEKKGSVVAINENINNNNKNISTKSKRKKIAKQQKQIIEKSKILIEFFIKNNIIFFSKLFLVLFITTAYYLTIIFFEKKYKDEYIVFDNTINTLYTYYKSEYDVFITIKKQFTLYSNFIARKTYGISQFQSKAIDNIVINGVNYINETQLQTVKQTMSLPNKSELNLPTFDLIIQELINLIGYDNPKMEFIGLYTGNSCNILFNKTDSYYSLCLTFFSTLFQKGMSQVLIYLERLFDNTIYDLSQSQINLQSIFPNTTNYSGMELFFEVFAIRSYEVLIEIVKSIKILQSAYVMQIYHWIFSVYLIAFIIFIFYVVINMEMKKNIKLSFLNFICIVPFDYLKEDDSFIHDILSLKKELE